jgi:Protein of unknown function (DUF1311).
MKTIIPTTFFILSLSWCNLAFASMYHDYLNKNKESLCKDIIKEESYSEIYQCTSLMLKDSQEKLNKKVKEIDDVLKESFDDNEPQKLFSESQHSWSEFVKKQCLYKLIGYQPGSPLYQSTQDLCFSVENYRRLEVLNGEPSIP